MHRRQVLSFVALDEALSLQKTSLFSLAMLRSSLLFAGGREKASSSAAAGIVRRRSLLARKTDAFAHALPHEQEQSGNPSGRSGPVWHRALHAFSQQLFAGQDLSTETVTRISTVFEQGGTAADFLRWWIVFRCEDATPTTAEARALLRHGMWKQALFTASMVSASSSPPKLATTSSPSAVVSQQDYTEFGHYAVVAACHSGNWQLALKMCSEWKSAKELVVPTASSQVKKKRRLAAPTKTTSSPAGDAEDFVVLTTTTTTTTSTLPSSSNSRSNNNKLAISQSEVNGSTWQAALDTLLLHIRQQHRPQSPPL